MLDILQSVLSRIRDVSGETNQFGAYLHGSHAQGTAGPSSDIDVLVLCSAEVSRAERDAFRDRCLNPVQAEPHTLDIKVIPLDLFADDPWVDLQKARWIAGRRWHQELPPRTFDQAARESLLVLRVLIEDKAFAQSQVTAVRKALGRLCSVAAALVDGTAPSSAAEAVTILHRHPRDTVVQPILDVHAQLDAASGKAVTPALAAGIAGCVAAVVEHLRSALRSGELGPRRASAATEVINAWDDRVREAHP